GRSVEPLAHLAPAAELGDERVIEPRLIDAEAGVREQPVAEEALDVVALVGRAVTPDLDTVLAHGAYEQRARDRATEGRGVEVAPPCGLDVEGAALERRQAFARERVFAVDEESLLRAVLLGLARKGRDVRLVVLAQVGRERIRHGTLLAHPRDCAASVEAAGEGESDTLANRHGGEDDVTVRDRHSSVSRWWRSSSSSSRPAMPSRGATKIVFSPAIVPATSARAASSIASASGVAYPRCVRITTRSFAAVIDVVHRRRAAVSSDSRSMSAAPGRA